jgi:hypothetical protein
MQLLKLWLPTKQLKQQMLPQLLRQQNHIQVPKFN